MAAKVAVASDPDREQTAGGLRDHFLKNSHHQTSIVNDGYRMPTKFDITTSNAGVYKGPQLHQATADLLNDLLQKNQLSHHVYFSETGGFHNHTCHHLLAAYALGATPEELQFAYDSMEGVQRARLPIDQRRVEEMHTEGGFKSMLGDGDQFQNYLAFFWQKLEKDGWRNALNEYLFSGSEIAEELFVRLYAGIWHNLILVGYGVEFEQSGIVAEGLAGACVHSDVFGPYLLESEKLARTSQKPSKSLIQLLQEVRSDPVLCDKDHWQGGNSFAYNDDVASNAPPGMAKLASQYKIDEPEQLEFRTVELINVCAFIAGAAQRANKVVKVDFIFVHYINASIFYSAFLKQEWISTAAKCRLLEWYARLILMFYAASLGPELHANEIKDYRPSQPESTWSSIMKRCLVVTDDGHLPKLIRALAHGEQVSQPWEAEDAQKSTKMLPVTGEMWLQMANMAIDSADAEPDLLRRWVRGAGSDEAWAEVPDRAK